MKTINKITSFVSGILLGMLIILIVIVCLLTPEKTKDGKYTDVYKYWTDDVYLCRNFDCNMKGAK